MGVDKKYALLDTDFLYKSQVARNAANHTLTDFVMELTDYEFFCHVMSKEELTRHEVVPDPNPWLEDKIQSGTVKIYSDRDIVTELGKIYGTSATSMYLTLLQTSCDDGIPSQNGLGEKKTYVLIQMMEILHSNRVYVFCSDDFRARQSIASLTKPVHCISILGFFYKLMKMGHGKSEMQEYYNRLSAFLKNQTEYRVWSASGHQRIRAPIQQVFDDLYDGKFQMLRNGDLQYIK